MEAIGILTWLMVVLYEYHKKGNKSIDKMRALKVGVVASLALTASTLYSLGTVDLGPVLQAAVITLFIIWIVFLAFVDVVCQYIRQKYSDKSTIGYAIYVGGIFMASAMLPYVVDLIGGSVSPNVLWTNILTVGVVGAVLFYIAEQVKVWEMLSERIPQLQ
jgi:hypothetical protein